MVAENRSVRRSVGVASRMNSEILAEAEVEHLVGFVEHDGAQAAQLEVAALEVVAQPSRRADHEVRALRQRALLATDVHAADAADDPGPRRRVEPGQLAVDLQRQLAGGGDDEAERQRCRSEGLGLAQERGRQRQAVGHGLAGAGLGGDEEVAAVRLGAQHGGLDRGRLLVAALRERAGEGRVGVREGHGGAVGFSVWMLERPSPASGLGRLARERRARLVILVAREATQLGHRRLTDGVAPA